MNINIKITNLKQTLPPDCKLIAVSKTHPIERLAEAYTAGQRVFGENKVQEIVPKYEALPKDIEWHMIGHLQSNKVKYIAPFIHLIHSVDSTRLLEEINKQAGKLERTIPCLLQLHIAKEETKFGFSEDEVMELLQSTSFKNYQNIKIVGLMGMATFSDNPGQVRNEFRSLKLFFDRLKKTSLPTNVDIKELSMGMSGDYKIAIEEGSTMVRVGSAIFGSR
ncbi:MAG TPA: YggS family pyridoxal phosphate-dependent enzyme [Chryseolinea sp.]|nr:YggS family pyridoxal phosphate-dependent enzyme [Flavobacteriales bacterium]HPH46141.1 YggS family pyridoxal phosphate-dependent enzyme [Chryseolinea sp.]HPM31795.1 YggS family pyridoxal phosphate-dependent enzyme [Chryseolinea sp.]